MHKPISIGMAILLVQCLGVGQVQAATTAEIDTARLKGLHWLITHQTQEGAWKGGTGTEFAATAEALEALRQAGLKNYPYNKGVSWLANASIPSVDSLARAIQALWPAGIRNTGMLQKLMAWKNHSARATWGAYDHYMTSFPDTPLGLAALRTTGHVYANQETELKNAVYCEMLPSQRADGSWSFTQPKTNVPSGIAAGAILPTAFMLMELKAIKEATGWNNGKVTGCTAATINGNTIQTALDQGLAWLLAQRNGADGGFGDQGTNTVMDTALAYQALKTISPGDPAADAALDYLLTQQDSADGSWGQEAFQTALVLKLMPVPAMPLADSDGDGLPDGVEALMGTNPAAHSSRMLATGNGSGITIFHTQYSPSATIYRGLPYSHNLAALGGQGPYTWKYHSGKLPPGLTFDGALGRISGTPTAVGKYEFAYSVTDTTGALDTQYGRLDVVPPPLSGDLNGDGVVDGKDHAIIVQIITSILLGN